MQFLRKVWVRILVSLLGGGMVTEIIHISTGDPNRPQTNNLTLLYALIIFGVLALIFGGPDKSNRR
jgi:hypothetical protein